jgi:hypothetical protein
MFQGLIGQFAPGIAQGALLELLRKKKVTTKTVTQWVQENSSLWKQLDPEDQQHLRDLVSQVNDISWISPDWVIDALRKDMPGIASLFLGWMKARNWLDRQIKELKRELKK